MFKKIMPKFPSRKELDSAPSGIGVFALLPADDYQLIIGKYEEKTQNKFESTETEDVINFTLEITGFKDGTPAVDVDGKPANGRKMWFTARPGSIGFRKDGTASITRQFVSYAMEYDDIESPFELESWEQLLGKTVYAEIIQKTSMKGQKVNRISRFIKAPRRRV